MSATETSPVSPPKLVRWVLREGPLAFFAWILAGGLVFAAALIGLRKVDPNVFIPQPTAIPITFGSPVENVPVSPASPAEDLDEIGRGVVFKTSRSDNSGFDAFRYTVTFGDSLFGIADKNGIEPETLLWANHDVLGGNPDQLVPDMELVIPPVDGVYYQWEEGDTLEGVAKYYEASVEEIINWPSNPINDLTNPYIPPGTFVMIPGGKGEFQQWVMAVDPSGASGVSTTAYGPGGCSGNYSGAYGSGSFVWPTPVHTLTGNDYWDGHLALDLAAGDGLPLYAADSGVVVFAGWANGGYGYTVMIDHGNGYVTLYAHMAGVGVGCGQSVSRGQSIGIGGSSGNSTGPHVHFEVRYNGGFTNPWYVLPGP